MGKVLNNLSIDTSIARGSGDVSVDLSMPKTGSSVSLPEIPSDLRSGFDQVVHKQLVEKYQGLSSKLADLSKKQGEVQSHLANYQELGLSALARGEASHFGFSVENRDTFIKSNAKSVSDLLAEQKQLGDQIRGLSIKHNLVKQDLILSQFSVLESGVSKAIEGQREKLETELGRGLTEKEVLALREGLKREADLFLVKTSVGMDFSPSSEFGKKVDEARSRIVEDHNFFDSLSGTMKNLVRDKELSAVRSAVSDVSSLSRSHDVVAQAAQSRGWFLSDIKELPKDLPRTGADFHADITLPNGKVASDVGVTHFVVNLLDSELGSKAFLITDPTNVKVLSSEHIVIKGEDGKYYQPQAFQDGKLLPDSVEVKLSASQLAYVNAQESSKRSAASSSINLEALVKDKTGEASSAFTSVAVKGDLSKLSNLHTADGKVLTGVALTDEAKTKLASKKEGYIAIITGEPEVGRIDVKEVDGWFGRRHLEVSVVAPETKLTAEDIRFVKLEGETVVDSEGREVTSLNEFQKSSEARDELSLAVRNLDAVKRLQANGQELLAKLSPLQEMAQAGFEGNKTEDFVAVTRKLAKDLSDSYEKGEFEKHVGELKVAVTELKKLRRGVVDDDLETQIAGLEAQLDAVTKLVESGAIKKLVAQINSDGFDADTWGKWIQGEGLIVMTTIAAGVAAAATTPFTGGTSWVAFAGYVASVSAVSAVSGYVSGELMKGVVSTWNDSIRSDFQVMLDDSNNFSVDDWLLSAGSQIGNSFAYQAAFMGAAGTIGRISTSVLANNTANTTTSILSRTTARVVSRSSQVIGKVDDLLDRLPVGNQALGRFTKEYAQELIEEGSEAQLEGLSRVLDSLGFKNAAYGTDVLKNVLVTLSCSKTPGVDLSSGAGVSLENIIPEGEGFKLALTYSGQKNALLEELKAQGITDYTIAEDGTIRAEKIAENGQKVVSEYRPSSDSIAMSNLLTLDQGLVLKKHGLSRESNGDYVFTNNNLKNNISLVQYLRIQSETTLRESKMKVEELADGNIKLVVAGKEIVLRKRSQKESSLVNVREEFEFKDSGKTVNTFNRVNVATENLIVEGRKYEGYPSGNGRVFYLVNKNQIPELYTNILKSRGEVDPNGSYDVNSFIDKKTGLIFSQMPAPNESEEITESRVANLAHENEHRIDLEGGRKIDEKRAYAKASKYTDNAELTTYDENRYKDTKNLSLAASRKSEINEETESKSLVSLYRNEAKLKNTLLSLRNLIKAPVEYLRTIRDLFVLRKEIKNVEVNRASLSEKVKDLELSNTSPLMARDYKQALGIGPRENILDYFTSEIETQLTLITKSSFPNISEKEEQALFEAKRSTLKVKSNGFENGSIRYPRYWNKGALEVGEQYALNVKLSKELIKKLDSLAIQHGFAYKVVTNKDDYSTQPESVTIYSLSELSSAAIDDIANTVIKPNSRPYGALIGDKVSSGKEVVKCMSHRKSVTMDDRLRLYMDLYNIDPAYAENYLERNNIYANKVLPDPLYYAFRRVADRLLGLQKEPLIRQWELENNHTDLSIINRMRSSINKLEVEESAELSEGLYIRRDRDDLGERVFYVCDTVSDFTLQRPDGTSEKVSQNKWVKIEPFDLCQYAHRDIGLAQALNRPLVELPVMLNRGAKVNNLETPILREVTKPAFDESQIIRVFKVASQEYNGDFYLDGNISVRDLPVGSSYRVEGQLGRDPSSHYYIRKFIGPDGKKYHLIPQRTHAGSHDACAMMLLYDRINRDGRYENIPLINQMSNSLIDSQHSTFSVTAQRLNKFYVQDQEILICKSGVPARELDSYEIKRLVKKYGSVAFNLHRGISMTHAVIVDGIKYSESLGFDIATVRDPLEGWMVEVPLATVVRKINRKDYSGTLVEYAYLRNDGDESVEVDWKYLEAKRREHSARNLIEKISQSEPMASNRIEIYKLIEGVLKKVDEVEKKLRDDLSKMPQTDSIPAEKLIYEALYKFMLSEKIILENIEDETVPQLEELILNAKKQNSQFLSIEDALRELIFFRLFNSVQVYLSDKMIATSIAPSLEDLAKLYQLYDKMTGTILPEGGKKSDILRRRKILELVKVYMTDKGFSLKEHNPGGVPDNRFYSMNENGSDHPIAEYQRILNGSNIKIGVTPLTRDDSVLNFGQLARYDSSLPRDFYGQTYLDVDSRLLFTDGPFPVLSFLANRESLKEANHQHLMGEVDIVSEDNGQVIPERSFRLEDLVGYAKVIYELEEFLYSLSSIEEDDFKEKIQNDIDYYRDRLVAHINDLGRIGVTSKIKFNERKNDTAFINELENFIWKFRPLLQEYVNAGKNSLEAARKLVEVPLDPGENSRSLDLKSVNDSGSEQRKQSEEEIASHLADVKKVLKGNGIEFDTKIDQVLGVEYLIIKPAKGSRVKERREDTTGLSFDLRIDDLAMRLISKHGEETTLVYHPYMLHHNEAAGAFEARNNLSNKPVFYLSDSGAALGSVTKTERHEKVHWHLVRYLQQGVAHFAEGIAVGSFKVPGYEGKFSLQELVTVALDLERVDPSNAKDSEFRKKIERLKAFLAVLENVGENTKVEAIGETGYRGINVAGGSIVFPYASRFRNADKLVGEEVSKEDKYISQRLAELAKFEQDIGQYIDRIDELCGVPTTENQTALTEEESQRVKQVAGLIGQRAYESVFQAVVNWNQNEAEQYPVPELGKDGVVDDVLLNAAWRGDEEGSNVGNADLVKIDLNNKQGTIIDVSQVDHDLENGGLQPGVKKVRFEGCEIEGVLSNDNRVVYFNTTENLESFATYRGKDLVAEGCIGAFFDNESGYVVSSIQDYREITGDFKDLTAYYASIIGGYDERIIKYSYYLRALNLQNGLSQLEATKVQVRYLKEERMETDAARIAEQFWRDSFKGQSGLVDSVRIVKVLAGANTLTHDETKDMVKELCRILNNLDREQISTLYEEMSKIGAPTILSILIDIGEMLNQQGLSNFSGSQRDVQPGVYNFLNEFRNHLVPIVRYQALLSRQKGQYDYVVNDFNSISIPIHQKKLISLWPTIQLWRSQVSEDVNLRAGMRTPVVRCIASDCLHMSEGNPSYSMFINRHIKEIPLELLGLRELLQIANLHMIRDHQQFTFAIWGLVHRFTERSNGTISFSSMLSRALPDISLNEIEDFADATIGFFRINIRPYESAEKEDSPLKIESRKCAEKVKRFIQPVLIDLSLETRTQIDNAFSVLEIAKHADDIYSALEDLELLVRQMSAVSGDKLNADFYEAFRELESLRESGITNYSSLRKNAKKSHMDDPVWVANTITRFYTDNKDVVERIVMWAQDTSIDLQDYLRERTDGVSLEHILADPVYFLNDQDIRNVGYVFQKVHASGLRVAIESDLRVSLGQLPLRVQVQLFKYQLGQNSDGYKRLKIASLQYQKAGGDSRLFLLAFFGVAEDVEIADTILEVASQLDVRSSEAIFSKYNEILDQVLLVEQSVFELVGPGISREVMKAVNSKIVEKANAILKSSLKRFKNASGSYGTTLELLQELNEVRGELVLQLSGYQAVVNLVKDGGPGMLERVPNIEVLNGKCGKDLAEDIRNQMTIIASSNARLYPESDKRGSYNKFLSSLNDPNYKFYVLAMDGKVLYFFSVIDNGDHFNIGSMNGRDEATKLGMAKPFVDGIFKELAKDKPLRLMVWEGLAAVGFYESLGFRYIENLENHAGTGLTFRIYEMPLAETPDHN